MSTQAEDYANEWTFVPNHSPPPEEGILREAIKRFKEAKAHEPERNPNFLIGKWTAIIFWMEEQLNQLTETHQ